MLRYFWGLIFLCNQLFMLLFIRGEEVFHCKHRSGCGIGNCPIPLAAWNDDDFNMDEYLEAKEYFITCKSKLGQSAYLQLALHLAHNVRETQQLKNDLNRLNGSLNEQKKIGKRKVITKSGSDDITSVLSQLRENLNDQIAKWEDDKRSMNIASNFLESELKRLSADFKEQANEWKSDLSSLKQENYYMKIEIDKLTEDQKKDTKIWNERLTTLTKENNNMKMDIYQIKKARDDLKKQNAEIEATNMALRKDVNQLLQDQGKQKYEMKKINKDLAAVKNVYEFQQLALNQLSKSQQTQVAKVDQEWNTKVENEITLLQKIFTEKQEKIAQLEKEATRKNGELGKIRLRLDAAERTLNRVSQQSTINAKALQTTKQPPTNLPWTQRGVLPTTTATLQPLTSLPWTQRRVLPTTTATKLPLTNLPWTQKQVFLNTATIFYPRTVRPPPTPSYRVLNTNQFGKPFVSSRCHFTVNQACYFIKKFVGNNNRAVSECSVEGATLSVIDEANVYFRVQNKLRGFGNVAIWTGISFNPMTGVAGYGYVGKVYIQWQRGFPIMGTGNLDKTAVYIQGTYGMRNANPSTIAQGAVCRR